MKHAAALVALAAASVLGVAACGGGGGPPAVSASSHTASPSTTPQPGTHTAQPGEPALVAVPGYDYADSEQSFAAAKEFLRRDPEHYLSVSAHEIQTQGGLYIGNIILIKIKPQYDNPATTNNMQRNLAEMFNPRLHVTLETIGGEKVATTRDGNQVGYAWYHNGTITVVNGEHPSALGGFVNSYLRAAHE